MENAAFTCLALSPAGCIPQYGPNNFHEYEGRRSYGVYYFCAKSETAVGTIGGGKEFAAHHWNKKHAKNGIDAPEGWNWGELNLEHCFMGGTTKLHKHFVGFKIDGDAKKGFEIHFFDLTTQKISTICVPKFKGSPPISVDISEAWCTDNSKWRCVYVTAMNCKWFLAFKEILFPSV